MNHFLPKNKAEAFLEFHLQRADLCVGAAWDPLGCSGGSFPSQVLTPGPIPLVFGPKVTCEQGCPHTVIGSDIQNATAHPQCSSDPAPGKRSPKNLYMNTVFPFNIV